MILQFASRLQRSRQPPCRPAGRPGQMRWFFSRWHFVEVKKKSWGWWIYLHLIHFFMVNVGIKFNGKW